MLLLAQAATLSRDSLQRGVIEMFTIESPVLDRLDFLAVEGNAYAYNMEATLPGVEFRAVNAAYSESTGTVNQASERIVILGGEADVDRFIQQTRSNLNNQRALQDRMKVKAMVYKFQDSFINGDSTVDANSFDGLKRRLVGGQVIAPLGAPNGRSVMGNNDSDRQDFLDDLDRLIASVNGGPNAFYCNQQVLARFKSATRRLLIGEQTLDNFGKMVSTYQGIPFIDIGRRPDGTQIIPNNEVLGTATDASSIYAVRFGTDENDQAVTGLANGTIQVDDLGMLETKPAYRTRIEFYCGLAVFGGKGAARLTGVRQ